MPAKSSKTARGPVASFPPALAEATVGKPAARPSKLEERSGVGSPSTRTTPRVKSKKSVSLTIEVFDTKGKVVGKVELPKEMFGVAVNNKLIAQAVRVYLANQRRGTVSTKTRGEVHGSSRKIYRQKGTGRARHGSIRAPIFVKGGIVFGPKPRDYSLDFPKNMRRKALFSALSARVKDGAIKVVKGLEKLEPKTKYMAEAMHIITVPAKKTNLLLVLPKAQKEKTEKIVRAARNIEGVSITFANQLNTYTVMRHKTLLFVPDAIDSMHATFVKGIEV